MRIFSTQEIITEVCAYYSVKEPDLRASRRGCENLPRDVAIDLARCTSRMTLSEIGAAFDIANDSTVSSAAERIKIRMIKDVHLRQDIDTLQRLL